MNVVSIHGRGFELYVGQPKRVHLEYSYDALINDGWTHVITDIIGDDPYYAIKYEMITWLDDNIKGYYMFYSEIHFLFSEEEDAVAFKLRW